MLSPATVTPASVVVEPEAVPAPIHTESVEITSATSQPKVAAEASATKAAAVDIPEAQLTTEVQALLVNTDLASVTVGQLRGRLEERLGLQPGVLTSRKRLRRQLSWTVQQEVSKKAKRSPECDRIVKALIEFEEYPASSRQMLIDSLPQAMAFAGKPHTHQVKLLQIVHEALDDAKKGAEDRLEVSQARLRSAEEEQRTISGQTLESDAVEAGTAALVTAAEEMLNSATESVRRAEEDERQVAHRSQMAAMDTATMQERLKVLSDLMEGPLQTLLEGTWEEKADKDACLSVLQEHLGELGAESAMLDAVPVALGRKPSDRGIFDKVTADEVKRMFTIPVEELTARITQSQTQLHSIETERMAASALLDAARQRAQTLAKSLEHAHEQHAGAVSAGKTVQARVISIARMADLCQSESDLHSGRVKSLVETIAIVQRLIDGSLASTLVDDGSASIGSVADDAAVDDAAVDDVASDAEEHPCEDLASLAEVGVPEVAEDEATVSFLKVEGTPQKKIVDGSPSPKQRRYNGSTPRPPPTPQTNSMNGRLQEEAGLASPSAETD